MRHRHATRRRGPEDIAWTFARVPSVPDSPALFTPQLRTISAIEIRDPRRIIIRTHQPNPPMLSDLSGPDNPATSDFTSGRLAIGTGPYRLVGFAHNQRLELARNEAHWGPPEPWDRVVIRYIPQPGSRTAALLAGEVDLIDFVPAQDVPRLDRDPRFALFKVDSLALAYVFPDSMRDTSPFVADRRVRQAMSLALPRQAIAERLCSGLASPADQFATPAAEHRLPKLPPLPHDPARARALLAEAGYPDGFRLTIHGPNGNLPADERTERAGPGAGLSAPRRRGLRMPIGTP